MYLISSHPFTVVSLPKRVFTPCVLPSNPHKLVLSQNHGDELPHCICFFFMFYYPHPISKCSPVFDYVDISTSSQYLFIIDERFDKSSHSLDLIASRTFWIPINQSRATRDVHFSGAPDLTSTFVENLYLSIFLLCYLYLSVCQFANIRNVYSCILNDLKIYH